ncbi:MAG: pentapeptide repeat-containing protein [Candidatus Adiutrix sp.]|jgi:uncharacterized protein YjbI with pentapeptide repeats|nr:pentapeptide repeat-containing protein [Candidatus Adiutrix sp.]
MSEITDIKRAPRPKELFEENRQKFNEAVAKGLVPDFSRQNLSDLDLMGFDLHNANLSGAYLRGVSLCGVDLSDAYLHGASLKGARVSGCLFPPEISAQEILLSLDKGIRIRHIKPRKQG